MEALGILISDSADSFSSRYMYIVCNYSSSFCCSCVALISSTCYGLIPFHRSGMTLQLRYNYFSVETLSTLDSLITNKSVLLIEVCLNTDTITCTCTLASSPNNYACAEEGEPGDEATCTCKYPQVSLFLDVLIYNSTWPFA